MRYSCLAGTICNEGYKYLPMKNLLLVSIMLHLLLYGIYAKSIEEESRTITYYISKSGSDKNNGSIDKPFATIGHISKIIDLLNKNSNGKIVNNVNFLFREGVYFISRGTIFDGIKPAEGVSINISAYNNEHVILSGGRKIYGENFRTLKDKSILERLPSEVRGKVWVIDLKKEGITDYGILKQHGFGTVPEPAALELFINGQPQTMARYPNEGILKIGRVYDKGSVPRDGDFSSRGPEFGYEYDRPERWKNAQDIWLYGKFSYGFNDDNLKIESIDYQKKSFKIMQPHIYGVMSTSYPAPNEPAGLTFRGYCVYNLLEEIDQPGEYYLDRSTGKLYIYPSLSLAQSDIEISLLESPIITIRNSHSITVNAIDFTCTRGMGIYLEKSHDIIVDSCEFINLGTVAISMGEAMKDNMPDLDIDFGPRQYLIKDGEFKNITISNCLISNTGTGGIILHGGDRKILDPGNNLVYNCEFHHTDRINSTYSPAIKMNGVRNIIRNCYFHDMHHQAIYFNGNDNLIEYNKFEKICTDAHDMGAVYTCRNPSARGTFIQYNYFLDILPNDKDASISGIYFDDGSGGNNVKNNFFCKTGNPGNFECFAAVFSNGAHDFEISGNIFMDCKAAIGNNHWEDAYWIEWLGGVLIQNRVKNEVNIFSEVYQRKYPELKEFFTVTGRRLIQVKDNIMIRTPLARFGDFMLQNNLTLNDVGELPQNINYEEIQKYMNIKPFPFTKVGLVKQDQQ